MAYNRSLQHFVSQQDLAQLWASGQAYVLEQIVIYNNTFYRCTISHTSNISFATDLAAGRWVQVGGINGSSSPFDVAITALNVDWSIGDTFYKLISSSSTFTFSNTLDGKTILVILKNTGASNITVTFPAALTSGVLNNVVQPNKENIYTFVRSNGKLYVSAVTDLA